MFWACRSIEKHPLGSEEWFGTILDHLECIRSDFKEKKKFSTFFEDFSSIFRRILVSFWHMKTTKVLIFQFQPIKSHLHTRRSIILCFWYKNRTERYQIDLQLAGFIDTRSVTFLLFWHLKATKILIFQPIPANKKHPTHSPKHYIVFLI